MVLISPRSAAFCATSGRRWSGDRSEVTREITHCREVAGKQDDTAPSMALTGDAAAAVKAGDPVRVYGGWVRRKGNVVWMMGYTAS